MVLKRAVPSLYLFSLNLKFQSYPICAPRTVFRVPCTIHVCCCYTEANIVTDEETGRNLKFAIQFAKKI